MKQKTPAENEEQPTENEQQHVQSPSTPSPKKELSVTVAQADEDETAAIVRDAMQYAAQMAHRYCGLPLPSDDDEHTSEAALSDVANDSKDNHTEDKEGEKDVAQSEEHVEEAAAEAAAEVEKLTGSHSDPKDDEMHSDP
jgi:hypothetical protein